MRAGGRSPSASTAREGVVRAIATTIDAREGDVTR